MNDDAFVLRAAHAGDAPALGRLHATCWQESYAGLVPAAVLASSTVEARTDLWRRILDPSGSPAIRVLVAESRGEMVGFGAGGPQRTAALVEGGFDGEVSALYVRVATQGRGVGSALFWRLAGELAGSGFGAVALWVLRENRQGRRFYERAGGTIIGARDADDAGVILPEVAYGWRKLAKTVEAT